MSFLRNTYSTLTDEQFLLIGKIVVEFSTIEVVQSLILSRLLLSPDFLGRAYTENINASQIQVMLKNACNIHEHRYKYKIVSEELIQNIRHAFDKLGKLRVHRNKFAHYCWTRYTDEEIAGLRFPGKLMISPTATSGILLVNIDELRTIQKESFAISDELTALLNQIPELEESKELISLLKWTT